MGEKLTVPYIIWAIITILPLGLGYLWRRSQAFAAANGKLLLFRRKVYEKIGGHSAVRTEAAEDVALCRRVKAAGFRWQMVDATDFVTARMYDGFKEAFAGFSKNLFGIFDYRLLIALFVWFWMVLIVWYPIVHAVQGFIRKYFTTGFWESLAAIALTALTWFLVALKTRLPWFLGLIYPLPMSLMPLIGYWSIILSLTGKNRWKERRLVKHRIKMI